MSTPSPIRINAALPADCRSRLMEFAREVNFDEGTRLFREGVVRTGSGSSGRAP